MAERIPVTMRVSPDARRGLERLCHSAGITLTALVEAIGLEMLEHPIRTEAGRAIVERARQIDLERRSRR